MNDLEYIHAQNKAWQVLITAEINSLPVSTKRVCEKLEIVLVETKNIKGGYTTVINKPYIAVGSGLPPQRKRFTIAHEIGHIVMGHIVNGEEHQEALANVFALALLAPGCILRRIGVSSAEEIEKLCNISSAAAEQRWLMTKNNPRYYISPLAEELEEQFSDFIKHHT